MRTRFAIAALCAALLLSPMEEARAHYCCAHHPAASDASALSLLPVAVHCRLPILLPRTPRQTAPRYGLAASFWYRAAR